MGVGNKYIGEEKPLKALELFFSRLAVIEKIFVCLCLGTMVVMVLIQIVLRDFFNEGIVGGDSLVKHMVLWVGFLGASLATGEGRHIRIDLASKIFPDKLKPLVKIAVDVFSILVCSGLVYASCEFVIMEYQNHGTIPFYNIPVWVMEIIIPLGFILITLRFVFQVLTSISKLKRS